ncbi:bll2155 [Bradyrhizobium diazoefficiens USDA 110]|uniref:Bll2155 protein n=3 Tax=Bradyrhizobium TaxID=374 RepID=Q89T91_BRADU|nr:bll2155 [Bradyrhizobium diazoefficiens USDA 110]
MGLVKERAVARAQRLTTGIETWVDREVAGCEFKDERLGRRFCKLLAQIGSDMGQSIPLVCQDWANTKAAYRFFSNERVDEADTISIGTAFCNTVRTSLYFLGQVHASLRQWCWLYVERAQRLRSKTLPSLSKKHLRPTLRTSWSQSRNKAYLKRTSWRARHANFNLTASIDI